MRFTPLTPPRCFTAGRDEPVTIRHCADIALEPDEQITLVTDGGTQFDVVRKEWGYYATPSLNGRLPRFGLRPCLARNADGMQYVLLVERGMEEEFGRYLSGQGMEVLIWLDQPLPDGLRAAVEEVRK